MITKCKYRDYVSIRNYAEHRLIKVEHALTSDQVDDAVYEMQYETEKRFTCNSRFFFFENDTDALLFRLRYGK